MMIMIIRVSILMVCEVMWGERIGRRERELEYRKDGRVDDPELTQT